MQRVEVLPRLQGSRDFTQGGPAEEIALYKGRLTASLNLFTFI